MGRRVSDGKKPIYKQCVSRQSGTDRGMKMIRKYRAVWITFDNEASICG